ncbi:VWA domain-containing protein [Candidatus Desantisbacteria bacterium]|nr:VWA domain-containing protein [Candidatus Desantisbacteria bacterium]
MINQAPTIDPAASYLTIEEYVKVRKEIMWDISFISPVFLAGILASILPLIIHFFIRKNVETIPFSFIHFLEMASQKKLRRVKLSRILLLLVRMLILILVALALAKPFMHAYGGMSLSKGENSSTVILLDNSYSMSMIDTNVTRLDQAKDEVRAILNLMSERDEICIIPFSSKNSPVLKSPGFTHDKMRLIQELNNIKISPYTTDIGEALKTADRLFRKSVNRSKTIIIITDLQKSGWSTVPAHGIISPEIKINIVNVGQKNASNTAVTLCVFLP